MTCVRRNLRIMLFLVTCLALWNLSNSAVIRPERSPKQYAAEGWKDLKTIPPFDWKKFTMAPIDWKKFTMPPIDWKEFTMPPIDWKKFTMPDFDNRPTPATINWDRFTFNWKKFTFSWIEPTVKSFTWDPGTIPDNSVINRHRESINLKLAIFLPIPFVIFTFFICKCFVFNGKNNSNGSAWILNAPRSTVPPSMRREFTNPQSSVWTIHTPSGHDVFLRVADSPIPPGNTGSSQGSYPLDKPPDYSAVVLGDFIKEGQTDFPSVVPTIPDTPPPQYDDAMLK